MTTMTTFLSDEKEKMWEILEDGPKCWSVNVQEDSDGDFFLVFPPEMLTLVDWHEGDTIDWHDNGDGSFTLSKV